MTQEQLDIVLKLVQASVTTERLLKKWHDTSSFTREIEVSLANSRLALFRAAEQAWEMVSESDAAKTITEGSKN
jgi:hypothetical protein